MKAINIDMLYHVLSHSYIYIHMYLVCAFQEVAKASNRYPVISLEFELSKTDNINPGESVQCTVHLERDLAVSAVARFLEIMLSNVHPLQGGITCCFAFPYLYSYLLYFYICGAWGCRMATWSDLCTRRCSLTRRKSSGGWLSANLLPMV